ncbi:galactosyltransferase [Planomonospora sphaerica]|uniref:Galactosyltransferase n=1 Tax=Planomonospora sphaerica TaxID=161355 RepID=A0A171DJ28_9ACTN|nr:glycosyltransferase [Planomonospora sphaerica]GAT68861.1 galactosyltransferase [Planomonospora sphaerica]
MLSQGRPLTIAFCLLSFRPDHPSGIERSLAALIEGVRQLGHEALVLAAGPAQAGDAAEPGLIRLASVQLPRPATNNDVLAALADPAPVVAEVAALLTEHAVDLVCWGDTLWGLGYLDAAPPGVRSALMVHKVRPARDERWHRALAAASVVCPASTYLAQEGVEAGWDTTRWRTVPNALLMTPRPVPSAEREMLRRDGPVRVVSRVEPAKGLAELVDAIPPDWNRPIELVLAEADFEFWPGMQADVIAACRAAAARRPGLVTIRPALGWRQVPGYLAGAAVTIISSIEPETFCFTAAEALSVGTPVISFDFGNVPLLAGPAGRMVPLPHGAEALWEATDALLKDARAYHAAATAAPGQVAAYTPAAAAEALLAAAASAPPRPGRPAEDALPVPPPR